MELKKVAEKKLSHILYQTDNGFVLSVLCGSVGVYAVKILLSSDEGLRALSDAAYMDKLAADVRANPSAYEARRARL